MSRERALVRRLRTLGTLEEAVTALRALSAQHFRAARAPLAAVRAYRDEVQGFLGVLDGGQAAFGSAGPAGLVLVTADLGLVGDYTMRLVREALDLRDEVGPGPLLCLGRRALSPLAKAGIEPDLVQAAPASVAGLANVLLPLVDALSALRSSGRLGALWLVAARFDGAGEYTPVRVPLLPVAAPPGLEPLESSPYCDATHLHDVVVREYLYASIYESLIEALASEHGKRLVTAESARSWLEERMDSMRRLASAIRRESSTQEVLEVVVASRASRRKAAGTK